MSELVRGSGNVFADFEKKNAEAEKFKGILAAEIIKLLDDEGLSLRKAHARTGIAATDFSRIRNADLERFTVDRLIMIINELGVLVESKVMFHFDDRADFSLRENSFNALSNILDTPSSPNKKLKALLATKSPWPTQNL